MIQPNYDKQLNAILFEQNCISNEEEINILELQNKVKELVSTIGWEKLVSEWFDYLKEHINTRKDAFNFATWIYIYDFGKCNIKNPYPFLALLYKKLNLNQNIIDELDNRFDTPYDRFMDIYIDVLISSKLIDISDADYLIPEKDDKFLAELQKN